MHSWKALAIVIIEVVLCTEGFTGHFRNVPEDVEVSNEQIVEVPVDSFFGVFNDPLGNIGQQDDDSRFPRNWLRTDTETRIKKKRKPQKEHKDHNRPRLELLHLLKEKMRLHDIKGISGKEKNRDRKDDNIWAEKVNTTNSSPAVLQPVKPSKWRLFLYDHSLWFGIAVGATISLAVVMLSLLTYNFIQKNRRRNYCVDLNNLSLCTLGNGNQKKEPVYVRLSQLHNTRHKKPGEYIVSVMDQSNNFSVCSEESSSEEEMFHISDIQRMKPLKKSASKISMTSTPVKMTPAQHIENLGTPEKTRIESPVASPIITDQEEEEDED
ncbi:uncharacterized protein LOC127699876 isoform X1 [Mytilus californianus]|uniref:uncharacterized protein LOC127699876 isoform X1 n=1 Tax=Mytilus californianus TaxID=6549 RepID=UPI002246CFF1|nr:uncharacterized protein LOC127699876 isoform X1 [Mytilus californianus]